MALHMNYITGDKEKTLRMVVNAIKSLYPEVTEKKN